MKSLTNSSVDQETQQTDTPETPGAPGASSVVEDTEGVVVEDPTTLGAVVAALGTVDAGDSPHPGAEEPVGEVSEGRVEETDGGETGGGGEGANATLGGAATEAGGGAPGSSSGVT